jgi:hypothetical protein
MRVFDALLARDSLATPAARLVDPDRRAPRVHSHPASRLRAGTDPLGGRWFGVPGGTKRVNGRERLFDVFRRA